jgi:hypothetical protein
MPDPHAYELRVRTGLAFGAASGTAPGRGPAGRLAGGLDPSGAVHIDAEHPSRNRKVEDETCRRVGPRSALSQAEQWSGSGDAAGSLTVIPHAPNHTTLTGRPS